MPTLHSLIIKIISRSDLNKDFIITYYLVIKIFCRGCEKFWCSTNEERKQKGNERRKENEREREKEGKEKKKKKAKN